MEIRKNINVTLKDYYLFNLGLVKKTIITYAGLLIFICIIFNGMINGYEFASLTFWLNSLLFYVIGLVFLILYFGLIVFFASKRTYTPNKKYYENMELIINDEGIYQYSVDGSAKSGLRYDQIFMVKEDRISLVLLVNQKQGIIIPKKGFTKDELDQIRSLLNKK